jgi:hypothetical protein
MRQLVQGVKEIMLFYCVMHQNDLSEMNPGKLKTFIDKKLLHAAFQVYVLDKDKFCVGGKNDPNIYIQYSERDHLTEIEKDHLRLIFWEELHKSTVRLDCSDNVGQLELIIDGNTFGCMDDWGYSTFTNYAFISKGKKLNLYFESESFGEQLDKVIYFINDKGKCASIRNLDNNDDFILDLDLELSDAFEELEIQ